MKSVFELNCELASLGYKLRCYRPVVLDPKVAHSFRFHFLFDSEFFLTHSRCLSAALDAAIKTYRRTGDMFHFAICYYDNYVGVGIPFYQESYIIERVVVEDDEILDMLEERRCIYG